ncbi:MAG: anaerobic glycerol-3-phosphate dehydrogenase subunit GlpA [Candidatus Dormibacteraeota bacterium]|nr:anaerobic glycerol-3-phosphate dehydrogenase subunit GlpA [Candidatus Dormibacteraeota bacterium]
MNTLDTDVLVIGGGSTGAGVAWDSALRGLHVTLVDRQDFATGTSGRFHGLLHSGGRYAVRDPGSARECAAENRILRQVAADCIEDTGGLFVSTPEDDLEYADRFLAAAQGAGMEIEEVPVGVAVRDEPRLNPKIRRAFRVQDGSIDSWKMISALLRGAQDHGATVLPYHKVVQVIRRGDRVEGAVMEDQRSGEEVRVHAGCVVNAAGAWSGQVAGLAGCEVGVRPGKGVMVAINHRLARAVLNRCHLPSDGDIIVPVRTVSVIGTTDHPVADPDDTECSPAEVHQMIEAGELLVPGFKESRALRVWSGSRPLLPKTETSAGAGDREVSRSHTVLDHGARDGVEGLVTIAGGKFTTLRLMAEDTVDVVVRKLGREAECLTRTEVLPGSESHHFYWIGNRQQEAETDPPDDPLICECELVSQHDLDTVVARRPNWRLDDIRRALRVGMGPCQGGFCAFRVAGMLHQGGRYGRAEANSALREFVQERWKGVKVISWGAQARQTRLDRWIFEGVYDLEHLPE